MARFIDAPSRAYRPVPRAHERSSSSLSAGGILIAAAALAFLGAQGYIIHNTLERANAVTQQRAAAFASVEPLTAQTEAALRRFLNPAHVARGRRLGIASVPDRAAVRPLLGDSARQAGLAEIRTNALYSVNARMRYGVPYVVPDMRRLLELIGQRFQARLRAAGLPPYRFLVTSALRTRADQAALRRVNASAARGTSSHEFGTTADLHYRRFAYAAALDSLPGGTGIHEALLKLRAEQAAERLAAEHPEALKAVLGRTLLDLQEEGAVLVIYERRQPVYHITVAQALEETEAR